MAQIVIGATRELVEEIDVLKIRDLPLHPSLRELSLLQDPPWIESVIILQVAAPLVPLSEHFFGKLLTVIGTLEVKQDSLSTCQENLQSCFPSEPSSSLELFKILQGCDPIVQSLVGQSVIEEEYVAVVTLVMMRRVIDVLKEDDFMGS